MLPLAIVGASRGRAVFHTPFVAKVTVVLGTEAPKWIGIVSSPPTPLLMPSR